ncbi:MAG: hypothetical protein KF730_10180 [Sphingomonas sp.]|uniref:hypothetical protein n=1 Tax=Sphingomonas sp. TaxID=28214 RepID=UPI0025F63742|nr:hypothetical protein [Sphingomonas sp.]MBX3564929.1 hypothetical protein [Sphingomonas sp.]
MASEALLDTADSEFSVRLSAAEVAELEACMDQTFAAAPRPTDDRNTARWMLCLASEDAMRFRLEAAAKAWHRPGARQDRAAFVVALDRAKYALRHALAHIDQAGLPAVASAPIPSYEEGYLKAIALMEAADDYADACRLLPSVHAFDRPMLTDPARTVVKPHLDEREGRYTSLEFLLGADRPQFSPINAMVEIFAGPEYEIAEIQSVASWSPMIHGIVGRVKRKGDRLRYQVITRDARDLFETFHNGLVFATEDWPFPWGSVADTARYVAALQTLALYHLVSVHFGAQRHRLKGVGCDQICLAIERKALNAELARIANLPLDFVEGLNRSLVLGEATHHPDPALQPLIEIGDDMLAVPWSLVLSSNWPRNLLSLHARIAASGFDAASSAFERRMVDASVIRIPTRFPHRTHFYINDEEIDLVLVDPASHQILLCELRWMLQPGDVREVHRRSIALREKVAQTSRKIAFARQNSGMLLKKLGLDDDDWRIDGLVLVEGFGGTASPEPKQVPIVPSDVFFTGLASGLSLEKLHALFTTERWLPRSGTDYNAIDEVREISGVAISRPGFMIGATAYMTESLPRYFAQADDIEAADLRAEPWIVGAE